RSGVVAMRRGGGAAATPAPQRDAALSDDASSNGRIYGQASPAASNILTKATEYDFFMDPVPVEGAGSGFLIDPRGYILTNFHVVEGAQSIEVVLGDQSRYPAKFIGADQRNDVALVKIEPKGKQLGPLTKTHGEVIGINSAIYTPTGTTAGIGFAIPINTAKNIANDLITDGRVHRAFLGVETLSVNGWLSEALDLPVKEGLLVERAT